MKDPYEALGVSKNATDEEIKKVYRKLSKDFHPDRNAGDDVAVERYKEVQEAYEILSDPVKKNRYHTGPVHNMNFQGGSSFFQEVVVDFFGGGTFKGRNISTRVEIELKEVFTGCKKSVKIKKRKLCTGCSGAGYTSFQSCSQCSGSGHTQVVDAPFGFQTACPSCNGTGKASVVKCGDCAGSGYLPGFHEYDVEVDIPRGIDNGMQLRLIGQGEDSVRMGNRAGDLMVFILVKEHPIFNREGPNLTVEIPVSYTQLVLGDEIDVPTLNEGNLKVKVPEGSQSHTKFRIKGKGLPLPNGVIGDLIATLKIETPKSCDEEYKKVLEKLVEMEKKNVTPCREQWVKKLRGSNEE